MSGGTILQIFLYLQVFAMGVLATVAVIYARAHFKHAPHEQEQIQQPNTPVKAELSPEAKERLLRLSQEQFQAVLSQSANKLQSDLGVTTGHINNLVLRLASEIVSGELERYRADLSKLHEQAGANMSGISSEVSKHKGEIKAKIAQEFEAEKQRLVKQIDTKLADAVGSFLTETLSHNVDLGSQSAYLVAVLEEHKADFIKEVKDET